MFSVLTCIPPLKTWIKHENVGVWTHLMWILEEWKVEDELLVVGLMLQNSHSFGYVAVTKISQQKCKKKGSLLTVLNQ